MGPERLEALQLSLCFCLSWSCGGRKYWELIQAEQTVPKTDPLCSVRQQKVSAEQRKYLTFFSGRQKVNVSSKSVTVSSFGKLQFPAIAGLLPHGAARRPGALCPLSPHGHPAPKPCSATCVNNTELVMERPAASMKLLGTKGGFLSHYRFQTRGSGIHSHFLQVIFD